MLGWFESLRSARVLRLGALGSLVFALGCPSGASTSSTSPEPAPVVAPAPAPSPAVEATPPSVPAPAPSSDCAAWNGAAELPLAHPLHDGWVGPDGSAVLVGDGPTVVHHREGRWSTALASDGAWASAWGVAPDDVFAVFFDGAISHFDGHAWSPVASFSGLRDVWAAASGHVVAVGVLGTARFDGATWSKLDPGTDAGLFAIWGTTPDHVLAAGERGTLLRYDGERWSPLRSPTSERILSLSGTAVDDVYAATSQLLFHFDGRRWARVLRAKPHETILEVLSLARDHVVVVVTQEDDYVERPLRGSVDLRVFDGRRWHTHDLQTAWLRGAAASSADHTYVVDHRGGIHRYDRDGLRAVVEPGPSNWRNVHRIGDEQIAVTHDFEIWRERDGQWEQVTAPPGLRWQDAWIDELGHVVAVTRFGGSAAIFGQEEDTWRLLWQGPRQREATLHAIRSAGPGELLAVGDNGLIVRGNAKGWKIEPSGTRAQLRSLWVGEDGRAHAVGMTSQERGRGVIVQYDGERWTTVAQHVDPLEDVWGADDEHVYAVGGFSDYDPETDQLRSEAVIMRFDGEAWKGFHAQSREDGETYRRIAGNSPNDIFALRTHVYADGGEDYSTWSLDHFDGQTWAEHARGDGQVGSLSTTPHMVTLAVPNGLHRWTCRPAAGAPPRD